MGHSELGARCEYLEQQQAGRPRSLDSGQTNLDQPEPGHGQLRWTDHQEQDFFLRSVGPTIRTAAHDPAARRAYRLCEERHLPLLGWLGERQPEYGDQY